MYRCLWAFVSAFLLAAPFSGTLRAAIIVDQQYRSAHAMDHPSGPAVHDDRSTNGNFQLVTQTFTVGIPGKLVAVEPFVQANSFGRGSLIVEVFPTPDGTVEHVETATPLVSKSFTDRDLYFRFNQGNFGDLYVDFSDTPIPVEIGEQYVISLRTVGFPETGFSWNADFPDRYPGGGMLIKNQVSNEWRPVFGNGDGSFRTYVSVPEPSTLALIAIAGVALAVTRRKR